MGNINDVNSNKSFYDDKYKNIEEEQNIKMNVYISESNAEQKECHLKIKHLKIDCSNKQDTQNKNQFKTDYLYFTQLEKINNDRIKKISIEITKKKDVCDKMKNQIDEEEKNLLKFDKEINDPTIYKIVLLGITGHGKSTLCNRLCGNYSKKLDNCLFKISNKVKSETQKINKMTILPKAFNNFNNKITVIDTPGNFDSHGGGTDRFHSNNLIQFLRGCGGVNAFVLVKTRYPPRLDSSFTQYLISLTQMLGINFWRHVIVIITHISYVQSLTTEFKNYCTEFSKQIKIDLNLSDNMPDIPIIGIDNFDKQINYLKQINKLLNIIKPISYQCNALKSPLTEYKNKFETNLYVLHKIYKLLNTRNVNQINLKEKINEMQQLLLLKQTKCIKDLEIGVQKKEKCIVSSNKEINKLKNMTQYINISVGNQLQSNTNSNNNLRKRKFTDGKCIKFEPNMKKQKLNRNNIVSRNSVNKWLIEDILQWIVSIGYGKYVEKLRPQFIEDEINGIALKVMDINDLKNYGIKNFYDRKMIINQIEKLK
eukprot:537932_1